MFALSALLAVLGLGSLWQDPARERVDPARERAVVRRIEKLGGQVFRDEIGNLTGVLLFDRSAYRFLSPADFTEADVQGLDLDMFTTIAITSKRISDATLVHLENTPKLRHLFLVRTNITNEGLSRFLEKQRSLTWLELSHSNIGDGSLPAVGKLSHLNILDLDNAKITDKGVEQLVSLRKLRILSLSGNKVSDVGLAHLSRLRNLSSLSLDRTEVTDAGIIQLKNLTNLRRLSVRSTRVTEKGAETLHEHMPWLEILSGVESDDFFGGERKK